MELLGEAGYKHWRMVERLFCTPWFHVSVRLIFDDSEERRVLMVDDMLMLEHIISWQSNDMQVINVQVVLPPWMTGRESWSMETLTELRVSTSLHGGMIALYAVDGGRVYRESDSDRGEDVDSPQSFRLIYRRP